MKLPSEVDTYTFDELADCQDFDHNDKFVAFDKAAELWSHIIELREALEKNAKCPRLMHDPDCWKCKTLTNSIKKWGPSDDR